MDSQTSPPLTSISEMLVSKTREEQKARDDWDNFYKNKDLIKENCGLFPRENVENFEMSSFKLNDRKELGIIVLTKFRLIFKFQDSNRKRDLDYPKDYFKIFLFDIVKLEKFEDKNMNQNFYSFDVSLRDTRVLKFFILYQKSFDFFGDLKNLVYPKNPQNHFAYSFEHLKTQFLYEPFENGWIIYDAKKEFERQGISSEDHLRFTDINENFKLCETYPKFLVVHANTTDEMISEAADHRTKNRLPILSYYYKRKGKHASIWRSSQTKSGLIPKKSEGDVKVMEAIISLNKKLQIFDARPYINALANKVKGGGFEDIEHYTNADLIFCDIGNIHEARKSLQSLFSICQSSELPTAKFFANLESTNWYEFIHRILKFSSKIVESVLEDMSVLIHCSDGWDRTAQLASVSQILIDPYFRTIKGFAILVEKEWLSYGHQFGLRNGIYLKAQKEDQRSPIFLQFLDCVFQLVHQFPGCFEFNSDFLLFIARNCMINRYGTFMFNNEKERNELGAMLRTASIWTDVFHDIEKYKNRFYNVENVTEVLFPNYAVYNLILWDEYFMYNSPYVTESPIYIDDTRSVALKTFVKFCEYESQRDKMKLDATEKKYKEIKDTLYDIAMNIIGTEAFEVLDEHEKNYLTHIKDNNK